MRALQRLLELQRTYPKEPFLAAVRQAAHFGLYDLGRLEKLILQQVAGEFFALNGDARRRCVTQSANNSPGLRLRGIAAALDAELDRAEAKGSPASEVLWRLFTAEEAHRRERSLAYRLTQAKLPWHWTLDSFPFDRQPGVNRGQLEHGQLYENAENYQLEQRDIEAALLRHGRWSGERRLMRRDGSSFWVQVNKRLMHEGDLGSGVIASYVSVDERLACPAGAAAADRTHARHTRLG